MPRLGAIKRVGPNSLILRERLAPQVGLDSPFGSGQPRARLRPSAHVGARFDASVYAVFVDGGVGRVACGSGFCVFDVGALIAWQGEFTAALTIAF